MIAIKKLSVKKTRAIQTIGIGAIAAVLMSASLMSSAAEPAAQSVKKPAITQPATSAMSSCNTVMNKTKEFRGSPEGQIDGICKNNRNSPAYWSCMNKRIDKGQGFADAGIRCNKITASR